MKKLQEPIEVKPEYISISSISRFLYAAGAFLLSWILFVLSYAYLLNWMGLLSAYSLTILSLLTALIPALFISLSERILKRKTKEWSFSKFYFLQVFSATTVGITLALSIVSVLSLNIFPQVPDWVNLAALAVLIVFLLVIPFANFYTNKGSAILNFLFFAQEYEKNPEKADFYYLLLATKKLSKSVSDHNMEIDPYTLSLGLSYSYLQNRKKAESDLLTLVEWIEEPRDAETFKKFKQVIKESKEVAKIAVDEGFLEKSHWSLKQALAFLNVLVVPLIVAVLTVVIPELIKLFSGT